MVWTKNESREVRKMMWPKTNPKAEFHAGLELDAYNGPVIYD